MSDDDGRSWREARSVYTLQAPRFVSGLDEPGVVELANGTLWAWCRTETGTQYETFSHDGGDNWSVPVPSVFTSPSSPLSMKRVPGSGRLLAVWNPVPKYQTKPFTYANWGRSPLVAATSDDEGATWERFLTIEDDENVGFCYTAIHFTAEAALLAYCAGGADDGVCHARLRLRSIPLADLP
ncbi:MAG: exo-alpha-sialidase [Paenibacillaceae bacterium]|nr:exo-alpha-sialidase [Paenibacillaceae bacterium]